MSEQNTLYVLFIVTIEFYLLALHCVFCLLPSFFGSKVMIVTVNCQINKTMQLLIVICFCSVPEEKANEKDRILQEKEAELKKMQEMLAAMQAQIQQSQ